MLVIVHVGEQVFQWLGKSAGGGNENLEGTSFDVCSVLEDFGVSRFGSFLKYALQRQNAKYHQ